MEEMKAREEERAAARKQIHIGEFVLRPLSEHLLSPHGSGGSLSSSCTGGAARQDPGRRARAEDRPGAGHRQRLR